MYNVYCYVKTLNLIKLTLLRCNIILKVLLEVYLPVSISVESSKAYCYTYPRVLIIDGSSEYGGYAWS